MVSKGKSELSVFKEDLRFRTYSDSKDQERLIANSFTQYLKMIKKEQEYDISANEI